MTSPDRIPVIIGVGEHVDRPADVAQALEPVSLMAEAVRAADADGGSGLLRRIETISLVGLVSWRYADPVSLLCERLGIDPAHKVNASMGGETPIRLIHEAAVRIAKGEGGTAAIVGGESTNARNHARKAGIALDWTPMASREEAVRFPSSRFAMSEAAKHLKVMDPAQVYPFYEMATQHAWGETPAEAQAKSAALWTEYAEVAATNPSAWIRIAPSAEQIAKVGPDNRRINFPYPKLMVANPSVNQAGAVIVTSLAVAQELGVDEGRLVHIWGGASAIEPEDYLKRDRYDHSTAQTAALDRVVAIAGGDAAAFGKLELYSCFPVVPKMALRTLGLDPKEHVPTVTGGITFFGGPLNNYMTHATCAMVRALRAAPGELGLLYGQGGYVNKHHALVVSTRPPVQPLALDYSVQAEADAARDPVPELAENYIGPATIETYTVLYGRDGEPIDGIVILRTPDGRRTMARVPENDEATMAILQSMEASAIGTAGHVRTDPFGKPTFEAGDARDPATRPRKYCTVEREGPLTIVTIDRADVMNALTPEANAELAEVFDAFAADPDQWVAIFTGAGDKAFSAGNDLKATARAMARGASTDMPLTGFAGLTGRHDLTKPVIAAVNGVAMGGGFEIALACDIIVAADNAVFALPEPRVGLAALAGGLLRLPRQIGLKQAMGMILTGRRVGAEEGQRLGFVNEVVPAGEALAGAKRWAAQILECSPMSIRASKQVTQLGLSVPSLADGERGQRGASAVKALFKSADAREGPLAFAQKRKPEWKGR
ncbi:enoyl-CoA hydratase/isomerase family protein [Sphingomonas sp. CGMCC 1.13654]|uniref:Enoyl-CoA hydratase/isomerase family protein n=1 Tax=Sphingomonas chungangi TaxID=2683589 RepID=A0A838L6P7_9SPHN|nr:enoyl-CoA hydratase-related protein [Sphingomonas chungangi]MBA2933826.1 enoyl-CoA hydratase/isomerase family protein [Sphingomonas chungangi]MVW55156.1 enoyl-CoA hydratase [Sphingomonas chungangi]